MARCHNIRLIWTLTISTVLIVYGILRISLEPTGVLFNRKAVTRVEQQAMTRVDQQAVTRVEQQAVTRVDQQAVTRVKQQAVTRVEQQAVTRVDQQAVTRVKQQAVTRVEQQAVTRVDQQKLDISRKDAKEMKLNKTYKRIVKSRNSSVYMYSAIQTYLKDLVPKKTETPSTEETTKAQMSMIVITGWEWSQNKGSNFICCHMMKNGTVIPISSSEKRDDRVQVGIVKLQATHFTCPIINNSLTTQLISIESPDSVCPIDKQYYTVVENVVPNSKTRENNRNITITVCSKIAFGSLDAKRLIEWFEVHRMFGVDKVFSYLYKLNSAARKVFEYYENLGIVETRGFYLPEQESVNREVGVENIQEYNDEQVIVYDCQERARSYDYFAVVDTDEFMVPSTNVFKNAWKTFFDNIFQKPYIAGFMFPVSIHVTNWGPSKPNHSLFIGQYNNCTLPWTDRIKGIHMPSRVQPGSVSTHNFEPLPGFKRGYIDGKSASLHHFRWCREEWMEPRSVQNTKMGNDSLYYLQNATQCYDFRRFPSDIMQRVADAVQESVIRVINKIGV